MGWAGLALIAAAIATCPWLRVSPAYPTTYAMAPGSYSTDAIARGAATFAANCAPCHGAHGQGDGPLAASLTDTPTNLIEHALHHRPGDLFWWIAHGIPPTPMPAFSGPLDDDEIWNAIRYLHALVDSDAARTLSSRIDPWRPIVAPDFTFETSSRAQETLGGQRGREVLLVAYTLPQSLPRLRELALATRQGDGAGIRVIAVQATGASNAASAESAGLEWPTLASAGPEVASTYAMFACTAEAECASMPSHAEWLIDREGYLRARWIGVPKSGDERAREQQVDVEALRREPPHPRVPQGHMH
jgi:putative copper resistance protein D